MNAVSPDIGRHDLAVSNLYRLIHFQHWPHAALSAAGTAIRSGVGVGLFFVWKESFR
jgi:hypothetical protein